MRRLIILHLTREQAVGITALARQHGLIDESGAARGVEVVRLLMVIGLTPGAAARTRAAVAARINSKMMVASMGVRLSSSVGGITPNGGTPMFVPSRVNVRLDSWLRAQLMRFHPAYRDGHGKIQDAKILADFVARGIADPDLQDVTAAYARLIGPFRAEVIRMEYGVRQAFGRMAAKWAAAAGLPAVASGG